VRWGLVGTRGYAAKAAAPGIAKSTRGDLAAILGRDPQTTRSLSEQHEAEPFTDLDSFLTSGIEAVWITSPTWLHREQSLAALQAGLHVLCEKPLAYSAEQAWEMVEAARRADRVLATGYQGRYVPGHRTMAQLIRSGTIGDVTIARTYYGVHRGGPPPEWRQRKETARWGALADIGTHHLDLLRMLLGEVAAAQAMTGHKLGFETEDVAVASLRFDTGALGSLSATVNVWTQHTRIEIHGTRGALVAVDTNPAGAGDVFVFDEENPQGKDVTPSKPASVWADQIDAVTAAAQGDDVPYARGEDGARNVEILEELIAGR
jgi:1,5-anhydro-D-fructose reductase (1,5-anhydro-D-mannitol-forming)